MEHLSGIKTINGSRTPDVPQRNGEVAARKRPLAWLRLLHVRREAIYHLVSMIKSAHRGFDELNAQHKRRNYISRSALQRLLRGCLGTVIFHIGLLRTGHVFGELSSPVSHSRKSPDGS
jgi:hypothetical protein